MSDSFLEQVVAKAGPVAAFYWDIGALCKTLYPQRFRAPWNELHQQILPALNARRPDGRPLHQKLVVGAPRGIGKSSIMWLGLGTREILLRSRRFIVPIATSATLATQHSENLKRSLLMNRYVKDDFGGIVAKSEDSEVAKYMSESFSRESWIARLPDDMDPDYIGTMIFPRGSGQAIRGILFGDWRPDLLIFDDVEDRETIGNPEIRAARREWFYADVCEAVDHFDDNWQMVYIDTLKHEDALLEELLTADDWFSLRLAVCDEEYNSLCPTYLTTEQIGKMVELHKARGTLDVFAREMMNLPQAPSTAPFQRSMFQHYSEKDYHFNEMPWIINVPILDPARTQNPSSCESGIICWGIDTKMGLYYMRDLFHGRVHYDQACDALIDLAIRYNATAVAVEVSGSEELVTQPLRNRMADRRMHFEIIELRSRSGGPDLTGSGKQKDARIASLIPTIRSGRVWFNKEVSKPLEDQLVSWPHGKLVDLADAAGYLAQLIEKLGIYVPGAKVLQGEGIKPPPLDAGAQSDWWNEFEQAANVGSLETYGGESAPMWAQRLPDLPPGFGEL